MASLMFKITNEDAPDIRGLRAEIPADLAAVIERSLVKDADQRFQTGAEFAEALKAFMNS